MTTSVIQGIFDCLLDLQVNNEMGSERYVIYFLPGTYGSAADPLNVLIGYYTEVAGLGETPQETVINGKIEVYNRCFSKHLYEDGVFNPDSPESGETVCFALNNFWRALANLSINIVHSSTTGECRRRAMFWGISQASSMRRVDIRGGDLSLMDYCSRKYFFRGEGLSFTGARAFILSTSFHRQNLALRAEDSSRIRGILAASKSLMVGSNSSLLETQS